MASLQRLLRQQCQPRHQFRRPLYSSLLGLHACNATHLNTHNVQQGIRRQDGHGATRERAAVSVYAGAQLLRTHSAVLYKLVLFALLMAVVPIATYFGTLNYLWDGSTTFAAISAIAAANLILVGYVVVAFREDAASRTGPLPEKKTS
ncbi:vacuolar ATPase assembly integral membrane protein VMA21 [Cryptococcus neoformans Tu259-1]|uniref:Vacuolar ATPase assembly integral membrane protein VMA21 n=1 Tax=Cryptococcus neoformans Tu259-1 TaxID=1230072 RepID=A0A854QFD2_CRYNE|nr:vacuolar ATPase assembly integral membrane protein VMA21 [Cryptococcus neoformans var. grubii Tu259-1]